MYELILKAYVFVSVFLTKAVDRLEAMVKPRAAHSKGALDSVVVVLISIVIIIALAVIFRNQLTTMTNNVFSRLRGALGM